LEFYFIVMKLTLPTLNSYSVSKFQKLYETNVRGKKKTHFKDAIFPEESIDQ
jgi:hypothetical protein